MVTSADQIAAENRTGERRFYPRVVPSDPIHIGPDGTNQGMLRNLSENGLLVATPIPLRVNFVSRISVPVGGLSTAVNGYARVVWTDESTQCAGIQLLELSEQDRLALRQWVETEFAKASQREAERSFADAEALAAPPVAEVAVKFAKDTNAIAPVDAATLPVRQGRKRPASLAEVAVWGFLIGSLSVAAVMFGREVVSRGEASNAASVDEVKQGSPASAQQRLDSDSPAHALSERGTSQGTSQGTSHGTLHGTPDARASGALAGSEQRADSASSTVSENENSNADVSQDAPEVRAMPESNARVGAERTRNGATPDSSYSAKHPSSEPNSRMSSAAELSAAAPVDSEKDPVGLRGASSAGNAETGKSTASSTPGPDPSSTNWVAKSTPKPSEKAPEAYPVQAKITSTDINPAAANAGGARSTATSTNGTFGGARTYAAPVVQMNPPERATLEVRAPVGFRGASLPLPNSRVVESPGVTMHIERSVSLPAAHKLWPFNRKRTVAVGELVLRVDPQSPYAQMESGVSVRVKAMVARDGHVARLELISGPAVVAPDVMRAIREWQYQPTLVDGKPVETECDILVQFHAAARAAR